MAFYFGQRRSFRFFIGNKPALAYGFVNVIGHEYSTYQVKSAAHTAGDIHGDDVGHSFQELEFQLAFFSK
ncbi:hypothetical protein D9M68_924920 [compost metagenome]